MISMTVMYPNEEGGHFDFDYYLNTHMPMVSGLWTPMGMKGTQVNKGIGGGAEGTEAPFVVIAQVVFDSLEDLQAAQAAHGGEIFHDLANFTDLTPRVQISEVVG